MEDDYDKLFGDDSSVLTDNNKKNALSESSDDEEPQEEGIGANSVPDLFDSEPIDSATYEPIGTIENDESMIDDVAEDDLFGEEPTKFPVTTPAINYPPSSDNLFLLTIPPTLKLEEAPYEKGTYEAFVPIMRHSTVIENKEPEKVQDRAFWAKGSEGSVFSNARLVRWDDGSDSILIGSTYYDIVKKSINASLLTCKENSIMKSKTIVDQSMTLRKFETGAASRGIRMYSVMEDPEIEGKRAERAEGERVKARKRLEGKREEMEDIGRRYEREDEYADEDDLSDFVEEEENSKLMDAKRPVKEESKSKRLRVIQDSDSD